jgi:hypothetical protein
MTRSMTRALLAGPFTLHPKALRALGVVVPEPEPVPSLTELAALATQPHWVLPCTPAWDYDDYSPTSPRSSQ